MTSGGELELALAGAGWMAGVHGYAVAQLPGVRIGRVASRNAARAAEAAARMDAVPCTYDELPGGASGVIVATPPALHAEHALAAVAAGVGVLVEKPLCTTLADADRLVAAADGGARIAYAENLAHAPVIRRAIEHASQLHGIDLLEVRALQSRPTWGDFLTEGWGGGVLFDLGAHPLAVALLLAAPAVPVEVRATLTGADDHLVDEHAEVHLAFDSGLLARVVTSWAETGTPVWDAQVSAPDGVVRVELLPEVRLERNGVEVPLPRPTEDVAPQLEQLGYVRQIESFARDITDRRAPALGAAFGRRVLELTCTAYHSAGLGGAWVELPFDGPRDLTPNALWRGG